MFGYLATQPASRQTTSPRKRGKSPRQRCLRLESLEVRSLLTVNVVPQVETVSATGADDAAIWIHPTDPAQSTIIGTAKTSNNALRVYDLVGNELQRVASGNVNNVDLRYNFLLSGETATIVTGSNRTNDSIAIYKVDPTTRLLENVAARTISTGMAIYGAAMYRSPITGKYYSFVTSESGQVQQWELFATPAGLVDAVQVRSFNVGSQSEGLVADDVYGHLYVGEEDVALWKYGAEPSAGAARTLVDQIGASGNITADVEGLSIYYRPDGTGYLLASSQGANEFNVYERTGLNAYLGSFKLVAGGGIDAVTDTDGIDVTNFGLGSQFPAGVFVAQDNDENFKLVGWNTISGAFGGALAIDTSWDPRQVGAGPVVNHAPQVEAGATQMIGFGAAATLNASVIDDGQPAPAGLTIQWSLLVGAGTVQFGNASAVDTTATFSAKGNYILRLTASDGEMTNSDTVMIIVTVPSQSVSFQDGVALGGTYSGTRDTTIASDLPNTNQGSDLSLHVDGSPDRAALIAWDTTSVPPGSFVQLASIDLEITSTSGTPYQVYAAVRAWDEDEATWNVASQGVNWSTAGAQGSADRGVLIGELAVGSLGPSTIVLNTAGMGLVQRWINNPASNHGILIQRYTGSNGAGFASSEATNLAARPRLNVTFVNPNVSAAPMSLAIPSAPALPAAKAIPAPIALPVSTVPPANRPSIARALMTSPNPTTRAPEAAKLPTAPGVDRLRLVLANAWSAMRRA